MLGTRGRCDKLLGYAKARGEASTPLNVAQFGLHRLLSLAGECALRSRAELAVGAERPKLSPERFQTCERVLWRRLQECLGLPKRHRGASCRRALPPTEQGLEPFELYGLGDAELRANSLS